MHVLNPAHIGLDGVQVLILADWIKSRVFGRDIAIYSQGDEGAFPASASSAQR
jgi:hypothetical protein